MHDACLFACRRYAYVSNELLKILKPHFKISNMWTLAYIYIYIYICQVNYRKTKKKLFIKTAIEKKKKNGALIKSYTRRDQETGLEIPLS